MVEWCVGSASLSSQSDQASGSGTQAFSSSRDSRIVSLTQGRILQKNRKLIIYHSGDRGRRIVNLSSAGVHGLVQKEGKEGWVTLAA